MTGKDKYCGKQFARKYWKCKYWLNTPEILKIRLEHILWCRDHPEHCDDGHDGHDGHDVEHVGDDDSFCTFLLHHHDNYFCPFHEYHQS